MSEVRYLIISADGSRPSISCVDRDGLLRHLSEASAFAAEGGWSPDFLDAIPVGEYGSVNPGEWGETAELILKVEVVVPRPVTTMWTV